MTTHIAVQVLDRADAQQLYPAARTVAFTATARTVVMDLPADELPVRVEQHGVGGCTITYDDTRITGEQLLALLEEASARR